jgi:hypothetical protein
MWGKLLNDEKFKYMWINVGGYPHITAMEATPTV